MRKLIVFGALILFCEPLLAFEIGIGFRTYAKTDFGPSLELSQKINDRFNVRLAVATTSTTKIPEDSDDELTWNDIMKFFALPLGGDVDVFQVSILGDYHPWRGNFRLSSGVSLLNFDWYKDKTNRTEYFFGNQTFSGVQVASTREHFLSIENSISPYLGFGWSTGFDKQKGWSFNGDFGVSYITGSHPYRGFSAKCAGEASEANCDLVQSSARFEDDKLKDLDEGGGVIGMANLGISYKF